MKKFLLIVLGVIFMGVQLFAGDLSVERVQKKGELVVGLDDTFAPMGFRDEKGEIIGFDIDLAKEVGKRMGVKVKFLPCDWDGIILSLNSKKIDVVWNGMTITEKRKEQINFSKPYFLYPMTPLNLIYILWLPVFGKRLEVFFCVKNTNDSKIINKIIKNHYEKNRLFIFGMYRIPKRYKYRFKRK